ncbi:hypothetical protein A6A04_03485 [Paramagnetospirillum marisnigri]|uniref:Plasmid stabilization protein n=1 Tax=Paramagnetospirillum marisnigri TaxID=1285242 RepID=A0A178MKI1_9PROT|nr:type II toxin-antitoxin system RelE/ParE family toxin [Paramagnetospirillum marisnigri]OAN49190.1 hypothetical protein A6A04_03485 [Paramagnetospirillum marisnigri]
MRGARLRPAAGADLEEIGDYIALDNPMAACQLIQDVMAACGLLAISLMLGRGRSGLASGVRSFPVGRYIVFYTATPDGIDVIRILHGARDVRSL